MPIPAATRAALNARLDREVMGEPVRTPPDYTASVAAVRPVLQEMERRGWALRDLAGNPIPNLSTATRMKMERLVLVDAVGSDGQPYQYPLTMRSKTFVGGPVRDDSGAVAGTTETAAEALAILILHTRAHDFVAVAEKRALDDIDPDTVVLGPN